MQTLDNPQHAAEESNEVTFTLTRSFFWKQTLVPALLEGHVLNM